MSENRKNQKSSMNSFVYNILGSFSLVSFSLGIGATVFFSIIFNINISQTFNNITNNNQVIVSTPTQPTSYQAVEVCPPNGVIRTGVGMEMVLDINVPDNYVQYLGGTRFDDAVDGVLVTIVGPYSGEHRLFQGAFCEPVELGSAEDEAAKNQIIQEVANGGVYKEVNLPEN